MKLTKYLMVLIGGLLVLNTWASANEDADTWRKPRVVIVRSSKVWKYGKVDKSILNKMVTVGITKLTGRNSRAAWSSLFRGCRKVALKVNTITQSYEMVTRPELAWLTAGEIIKTGITARNVSIYDRGLKCKGKSNDCVRRTSMKKAGYRLNRGGNKIQVFEARKHGNWQRVGSSKNRFFTVLEQADCLVNMPILKDHHIMGVTFALKNHVGSVSNPELFHKNAGVPQVAYLNGSSVIRKKHRLVVGDVLRAQYNRGPHNHPEFHWNENAIILGVDPVAVDRVALAILVKKREQKGLKFGKMAYGGRAAQYIFDAGKKGLGVSSLSQIEVIQLTVN